MNDHTPQAIGYRLRLLRTVKGYGERSQQKEWAKLLGVSPQRYNNWERGLQRITLDPAREVERLTGANVDYIYNGVISALPMALEAALREADHTIRLLDLNNGTTE